MENWLRPEAYGDHSMADMSYVTSNKLTDESNQLQRNKRLKILAIGAAMTLALLFIHVTIAMIVMFGTFIAWVMQQGDDILKAGAAGEDKAIRVLSQLPDGFTVFNQVNIPNACSKVGFNEADIIVSGPNTVFVIEVKHNNGHIHANIDDDEWHVEKTSRKGSIYSKTMRNPIAQVKRLVWLLSEEMTRTKSRGWIQGIVCFTNEDANIVLDKASKIPVVSIADLVTYIKECDASQAKANHPRVARCIESLKTASV